MHHFTSPETLREICSAFTYEVQHAAAADRAEACTESASPFGPLADSFVKCLALGSPVDLGKDWLLHRLHCILVDHQPPKPGEIEVMRADIRARAESSILSSAETDLLIRGVDQVLQSFTPWPVREAGRVRSEANSVEASP